MAQKTAAIHIRVPLYLRLAFEEMVMEHNRLDIADGKPDGLMTLSGVIHKALWHYVHFAADTGELPPDAYERYKRQFEEYYSSR